MANPEVADETAERGGEWRIGISEMTRCAKTLHFALQEKQQPFSRDDASFCLPGALASRKALIYLRRRFARR
jgi:hypothetical protein